MMKTLHVLVTALLMLVLRVAADPEVPVPTFTFEPNTVIVTVEAMPGMSMASIHMNLNEPLPGLAAGKYSADLTKGEDGFTHSFPDVPWKEGDTLYFWNLVIINGQGFQKTDQSYVIQKPTTTPPPTTTTKTTTTPPAPTTTPERPTTAPPSGPTTAPPTGPTTAPPTGPTVRTTHHVTPSPTTSVTTVSGSTAPQPGQIIFEDNFDTFDLGKWKHEITCSGGGNWEFEAYGTNRSNSYVRDGILYIKPTLMADIRGEVFLTTGILEMNGANPEEQCTDPRFYGCMRQGTGSNLVNPIMSAALRTAETFTFRYGRVEVKAKMPTGDWLWPAIWMLPVKERYGQWPASGEIDIVESRGNKDLTLDGTNIGTQMVASTLHWGPYFAANSFEKTHWEKSDGAGFDADFHTYEVEWTPEHIKFSVDGDELGTVQPDDTGFWGLGEYDDNIAGTDNPWLDGSKMAPFDQEYYLKMNLAVGGTGFFPDEAAANPGKPWSNESPTAPLDFWNGKGLWLPTWKLDEDNGEGAALQVDYIRVYAI